MSYNETEREYIEKIRKLLEQKQIPNELELKYDKRLYTILTDLNDLNRDDKYYLDKRREINQRLYVMYTELEYLGKKEESSIRNKETPQKGKIEDKIKTFILKCNELEKALNEVQRSLILYTSVDLNFNSKIMEIDNQLKELYVDAANLRNEIDEFRKKHDSDDFSLSILEIRKIVGDFQHRVKDIKMTQIQRYNAKVNAVNERVTAFKKMTNLDKETTTLINELELLKMCNVKNVAWNSKGYLKSINYNKLIETLAKIQKIENKMQVNAKNNSYNEELDYIEKDISEIDSKITDDLSLDNANRLKEEIQGLTNMLDDAVVRIKEDENTNTDDYKEKNIAIKLKIIELREKINEVLRKNKVVNDYRLIEEKIFTLFEQIAHLGVHASLLPEYNEETVKSLITKLDDDEKELDEIEKVANEMHNNGKLDDLQFSQLNERVLVVREVVDCYGEKIRNPAIIKNKDTFGVLNGRIGDLIIAINQLELYIDDLEKPIRDEETRKRIEKEIEKLENEISTIRKYLESYKDTDAENYEITSEKLEEQEERLDEISNKYRRKRPFLVKNVKSTKELYKKYKKPILIASGLAAIALVHATLGPVIIPAIIHGNIMMKRFVPALDNVLSQVNNVLCKAINAEVVSDALTLPNRVIITPYYAGASLLKGIAIVGMGTAAIVGPLVVLVKELINKMHLAELKQKMNNTKAGGRSGR